jgi:tetratricopeptide (TPR) repeat protein
VAVLGLNTLRNYAASGQAVIIASHGGLNFYIGNHDGADGTYSPVPGIRPSIAGQATDSRRVAEAAVGRPVSPDEVSTYFYGLGWEWIRQHPGRAATLFARKLGILVNRTNVPLNYSYAYYAHEENTLLRWLAVGPWLLFPFGLVGLLWPSLRERRHGYWAWGAFVPSYGLAVAVFFVSSRYRMPLLVPLCATAGAALARGIDLARARRWRQLAAPVAAVALLTLLVNWNLGLNDGVDGEQTRRAVWLVERGAYDEARTYAGQVSPHHAHPGVLAYRLGLAYLEARRDSDAIESFRRAEAVDGPRAAILLPLGRALMSAGRPAEAVAPLRTTYDAGYDAHEAGPLLVRALVLTGRVEEAARLVASMPDTVAADSPEVSLDFGTLALEQGDTVAAERWLQLAVAHAPNLAEASEKLGVALFLQGRPGEALAPLEAACRLAPTSASGHLNLAAVLAELRRIPEAREHAAEAVKLDPSEPRAAALLAALARRRP